MTLYYSIISRFTKNRSQLVVAGMVLTYAVFFTYFTLAKHSAFMTYMFDLGIYNHNMWIALTQGAPNFPFGMPHQSQLLYLLLPAYAVNPAPQTLLIIQALILPLGAYFLYKIAKHEIGSNRLAVLFAGIYLLYPPLHGLSQFDFHLEAFLPTFFLAAFYYFRVGRWRLYLGFIALTLISMGVASLLTLVFGLYLLLGQIKKISTRLHALRIRISWGSPTRMALITILLSLSFIALHYSFSFQPILSNYVFENTVSSNIDMSDRIAYVLKLYGPLGFLPLASLSQMVTLPWVGYVLFVTPFPEHLEIYNQYSAYALPFIFIGAVMFVKSSRRWKKEAATIIVILMTVTTVGYFATSDPVFIDPYKPITPNWPTVTEKDNILTEVIALIPPDSSVLTQNNISPHLTNREEIYIFLRDPSIIPDYILIDKSHFSFDEPNLRPSPAQSLSSLLSDDKYGLRFQCGPIFLYEMDFTGDTEIRNSCE